jgi:glycosyltransferase involved in cell wall biosynthesis
MAKTPRAVTAEELIRGRPLVTVVIPAYNAAGSLLATLESVERQTYPHIEVLVVDDGSDDGTAEIVLEVAGRDPRFRLIRQPNAGVGAARNRAIGEARGELIAPLDADDVWHPEKLAKQVSCITHAGESAGLVYCWFTAIDQDGRPISASRQTTLEKNVVQALILRNFIGCASIPLLRKSALDHVGYYLTRTEQGGAQGCEDRDLYLRIGEKYDFRVVQEHLVGYRQSSSAMSADALGMMRSFRVVMRRARARNPEIPPYLFRWGAGGLYRYLMARSSGFGRQGASLLCMQRAVCADPVFLLSSELYKQLARIVIKGCLRSKGKRRKPRAGSPLMPADDAFAVLAPAPGTSDSLLRRIEHQRWVSTLAGST